MKILKLQDIFNGSFGGILLMQLSSDCMWSKDQKVYLQHDPLQVWRILLPSPEARE